MSQDKASLCEMNSRPLPLLPKVGLKHLSLWLSLLALKVSALKIMVSPRYTPDATNTSGNHYMKLLLSGAADSYEYVAGEPITCLSTGTYNTGYDQLKCFKLDGTIVYSFNTNYANTFALAMTSNSKLVVGGSGSKIGQFSVSVSAGTYTFSLESGYPYSLSTAGSCIVSGAVDDSATTYVYFGPSNRGAISYKACRFDTTQAPASAFFSGTAYTVPSTTSGAVTETYNILMYNSVLVSGGTYLGLHVIDKSTMNEVRFESNTYASNSILFNNLSPTSLLYYSQAGTAAVSYSIVEIDLGATPLSTAATVGRSFTLPTSVKIATNMFNFGTLAYLGVMKVNSVALSVISKSTFNADEIAIPAPNLVRMKFSSNIATLAYFKIDADNVWATIGISSRILSGTTTIGASFMSFDLLLDDICTTRDDATGLCSLCPATYFRNSLSNFNYCLQPAKFPAANGADIAQNLMVACGTGCTNCLNDKNICAACTTPTYVYVYTSATNVYCSLPGSVPSGYGTDLPGNSSRVITCPQGCQSCRGDTRICETCDTAGGYFYKYTSATDVVCVNQAGIPAGWGKETVNTSKVVTCPTGCQSCTNNVAVCSKCDTASSYLYLWESSSKVTCITASQIPAKGFGYDIVNNTKIAPCSIVGCIDCKTNKDLCSACDSIYTFQSGSCSLSTIDLKRKSYDPATQSIIIQFTSVINYENLNVSDIRIDLYDDPTPRNFSRRVLQDETIAPDGKDIPFEMVPLSTRDGCKFILKPSKIQYGEYSKIKISSRSRNYIFFTQNMDAVYSGQEIELPSILLYDNSDNNWTTVAGMARIFQWILKLINFSFKILLMPLDFFLSHVIDRHTAFFSYLKVLDGPYLIYPGYIINEMSSRTFFGFWISNPHKNWSSDPTCRPPRNYDDNGLRCNAFENYGQNINILWAALILSVTVYLVCKLMLKPLFSKAAASSANSDIKSKNKLNIVETIDYNFGLRYFFLFMDGVSLELIGLSILNIVKLRSQSGAAGGGALSFIILIYYICYYGLLAYGLKLFVDWKQLNSGEAAFTPKNWIQDKAFYLTFMVQEYKEKQLHRYFYLLPALQGVKNFAVQIAALALAGSGFGQMLPILSIEIGFLLLLVVGRVKNYAYFNIYDILFQALCIWVIFMKLGATDMSVRPSQRQNKIGMTLSAVLFLIIYLTTIYVFVRIGHALYKLYKQTKESNKVQPAKILDSPDAKSLLQPDEKNVSINKSNDDWNIAAQKNGTEGPKESINENSENKILSNIQDTQRLDRQPSADEKQTNSKKEV